MTGYTHPDKLRQHIKALMKERDEWRRKAEEGRHEVRIETPDRSDEIEALTKDAQTSYRQLVNARRERDAYRAEVHELRGVAEERDSLARHLATSQALNDAYARKVRTLEYDLVTERNRNVLNAMRGAA